MSVEVKALYEFGPFHLDPENRLLLRDGQPICLTPKAFDALLLLLERSGRLVSKDDLMKALWPDTFVEESNLTQTVFMLRKALGESGGDQHYIRTVPGRGYRFAAEVTRVSANRHPELDALGPSSPSAIRREAEHSTRWRWPAVVTLAIALIVAAAAYLQWTRSRPRPQPSRRMMLAVLPFENLTGDAGQEYFSDGLTEEVIAQLGRLDAQHLGVIARTSVMRYKRSQEQLDQIGRELGVQYVLEGSVRRDSGKVRIAAKLIQVNDQTELWARQYDRELSNLLALQAEIARDTADEIQLTLGDGHKKVSGVPARQPSLSPSAYEAYELYLKGRYSWNKRTPQGLQQAVEYFQQAIAKDPGQARAYAGLADSYSSLGGLLGFFSPRDFLPQAKAEAIKALEIDDTLAEAYFSLAEIKLKWEWDWPSAEREYKRAIELNPNYAEAHQGYGTYLEALARFAEAIAERKRAQELDPLSPYRTADVGYPFYWAGQYDQAIEQYRRGLVLDPSFFWSHLWIGEAYVEKGMHEEAIAEIRKAVALSEGNTRALATLGHAYAVSGRRSEALKVLNELKARSKQSYVSPYFIALIYAGLGENDRTLEWLEKAYQERHPYLILLKVQPVFRSLHSDPHFQDLLRRVGLGQ